MHLIKNIDNRIKLSKELQDVFPAPEYLVFSGAVNDENTNKFIEQFTHSENECLQNKQPILPIVIDSPGGSVYSLLRMIDVIKSSKIRIATIVEGKAMSAGSLLFSCGHDRYMAPNATVMIHEVSAGTYGKNSEIQMDAKEFDRLNKLLLEMLATNCGHEPDYFMKLIHERNHADWFLDANECKLHKITSHVGIPSYKMNVSVDYTFGM